MSQKRWNGALGGAGFYTALALALVAVGIAGYFVLFKNNTQEAASDPESTQQEVVAQAPEVDVDAETEAGGEAEIPSEETPSVPELPVDDTPVVATEPTLVVSPVNGEVVTAFSVDALLYDSTMGDWRTHDGIDVAAAAGTAVLAASAGTVVSVMDDVLMGTTVVLSHNGGYQTTYANLQAKPTVAKGDTVTAGQVIGAVGTTSIAEEALGPHLHFAVTKDGDAVDPNTFLNS